MAAKNLVKAVGYARRSTDMQERSIPDQQAFVQRWAEEHGYTILRWFTDDAISGTSTKGREAFERMIHEAENGRDFDAILVYDISRFSRGGSTEMGFFLYRLQQAGVRVIFCAEALPDDDGGELLLGVKSWQARQYSVKLSRDSIRGAVSSVRVKRSAPGGRPPYGYDRQHRTPEGQAVKTIRCLPDGRKEELDPGGKHVRYIPGPESVGKVRSDIIRLVPGNSDHVRAVQRIFRMCGQGYGLRSTALALDGDGIPGPAGGRWNIRQVRLILNSRVYTGCLVYNKTTQGKIHGIAADGRAYAKKGKPCKTNGLDQWIVVEDCHEPLVSRETFEKAQREMASRRGKAGLVRPTKRHLLSGLLKCRRCGLNMWGTMLTLYPKKVRRPYYVDAGYRAHGPAFCKSTSIQAEPLEQWVLSKVRAVILGDAEGAEAAIDAFVKQVMAKQKKDGGTGGIDKELALVNRRIKTAATLLAESDLADMEELKQTLVDLKHKREALEAKKTQAAPVKGELADEASLRAWASEKLGQLGEALDGKLPMLETRRLLQAYIDRIEIDPDSCTGTMYLPADATAFFEAASIRRVNVGWPSVPCLSSPPGATGWYWSVPISR